MILDMLILICCVMAVSFLLVALSAWLCGIILEYYPSDAMMQHINDQIAVELDNWRKEVAYPVPSFLYGNYSVRCSLNTALATQKKVHRLASRVLWYRPKKNHPYYQSIKIMRDAHIRNCELYIRELLDAYENYLKDDISMR